MKRGFGTPAEVGELFLTRFLLAFEIASLLLLIAAVGAVILARRRAGLTEPHEVSVADVLRSGPPPGSDDRGGRDAAEELARVAHLVPRRIRR